MFEDDSADMFGGKCTLVLMGGRADGLGCADQGMRTPIGTSGILLKTFSIIVATPLYRGFSIQSRKVFRSFSKRIEVPHAKLYKLNALFSD